MLCISWQGLLPPVDFSVPSSSTRNIQDHLQISNVGVIANDHTLIPEQRT